jgi:hypothetical protein
MREIDVHGFTLIDALAAIVRFHNQEVGPGTGRIFLVNHGYGSTGRGGVIRHALRAYLIARNIRYTKGEHVDRNKGVTYVTVGREPISDDFLMSPLRSERRPGDNKQLFEELCTQFQHEKLRLMKEHEAEREKLLGLIDQQRREKDVLTGKLRERDEQLVRNAAQAQNLETKQHQLERERAELQRSRDELESARSATLANRPSAERQRASDDLGRRMEDLDRKMKDVDAQRAETMLFRKQLFKYREELLGEKDRIEQDLRQRTEQINQFSARQSQVEQEKRQIEDENRRLREELAKSDRWLLQGLQDGLSLVRAWRWWVFGASLIVLLICLVTAVGLRGCSSPQSSRTQRTDEPEKSGSDRTRRPVTPDKPVVISPADAAKWEGKEATVEFKIGSTHDGIDWAFVVNSDADFRSPKNFQVMIERKTAGAAFKEQGIKDLAAHFKKGQVVQVTGQVDKYTDKKSGRQHFEIKVKDPGQILVR